MALIPFPTNALFERLFNADFKFRSSRGGVLVFWAVYRPFPDFVDLSCVRFQAWISLSTYILPNVIAVLENRFKKKTWFSARINTSWSWRSECTKTWWYLKCDSTLIKKRPLNTTYPCVRWVIWQLWGNLLLLSLTFIIIYIYIYIYIKKKRKKKRNIYLYIYIFLFFFLFLFFVPQFPILPSISLLDPECFEPLPCCLWTKIRGRRFLALKHTHTHRHTHTRTHTQSTEHCSSFRWKRLSFSLAVSISVFHSITASFRKCTKTSIIIRAIRTVTHVLDLLTHLRKLRKQLRTFQYDHYSSLWGRDRAVCVLDSGCKPHFQN